VKVYKVVAIGRDVAQTEEWLGDACGVLYDTRREAEDMARELREAERGLGVRYVVVEEREDAAY
jgi:hypothetical protein